MLLKSGDSTDIIISLRSSVYNEVAMYFIGKKKEKKIEKVHLY